ncbi:TPA: hypothetical protein DCX15_05325 [bacterium]|nr:hypothetical protein [bacterium]
MVEEERIEAEEEKPKKAVPNLPIKLLMNIAIGIAGLLLVVIIASYVAKTVKTPEITFGPEAPEEKRTPPSALITWLAGPEFIAKLADEEEAHLVKTGEFRLAYNPKYKRLASELVERQFQISDIINTVLISQTSKDLSTEEGKERFKREVMSRINSLLTHGQIEDIYVQVIVQ